MLGGTLALRTKPDDVKSLCGSQGLRVGGSSLFALLELAK